MPGVLHGDDTTRVVVTFRNEQEFKVSSGNGHAAVHVQCSIECLRNLRTGRAALCRCIQEALRNGRATGLIHVDPKEEGPMVLINNFTDLVPGDTYMYPLLFTEAFARVLGETRHLQQSREDEFARALTDHARREEPEQVS